MAASSCVHDQGSAGSTLRTSAGGPLVAGRSHRSSGDGPAVAQFVTSGPFRMRARRPVSVQEAES